MPEPQAASGGAPYIQRACPGCEEDELRRAPVEEEEEEVLRRQPIEEEEEEEEELQAKATSDHLSEVNPDLESQIQSLKGGGQSLSEDDRAFFEPRFGYDFSQVRVHADAKAAETARGVNAQAYTIGQDVVFGAGQYVPGINEKLRLLAHELTHVIQQSNLNISPSDRLVLSDESSMYEREANDVADQITRDVQFSPHMANRVLRSSAHKNPEWASQRARSLSITPVSHKLLSRIRIRDCSTTSTPAQDPQEVQEAHDRALEMLNNAISLSNSPNQAVITAANDFFDITVPPSTFIVIAQYYMRFSEAFLVISADNLVISLFPEKISLM
jgi:hypothetical protein